MPLSFTEAGAASALSRFSFLGHQRIGRLYAYYNSFNAALKAERTLLQQIGCTDKEIYEFNQRDKTEQANKDSEWLARDSIQTIIPDDNTFPPLLRELPDPPAFLHIKGKLNLSLPCIAVVGTRQASRYGLEMTREIIQRLAAAGCIIVSGLALGIDAAAHQNSIQANGQTWAFLGSGLNKSSIYPPSNRGLAQKIIETGGALISEFPPGEAGFKHYFPIRNRLIAGVSLATVVIEASIRSGSLLTAKAALEYNREVCAVPADARRLTAEGSNMLIQKGAHLVTSADDIMEIIGIFNQQPIRQPTNIPPELSETCKILTKEPTHIDELAKKMKCSSPEMARHLSLLELSGHARPAGSGQWVRTF